MHSIAFAALFLSVAGGQPEKLKAVVSVSPERAGPGDQVELRIDCDLAAGWHIYAPDHKGTGLPARLEIAGGRLTPRGNLLFPEPIQKRDEILEEDVRYLGGKFRISRNLLVPPDSPPGKAEVSGKLIYQACSDTTCDPQVELPISASLEIVPGAEKAGPALPLSGEALGGLPGEPKDMTEPAGVGEKASPVSLQVSVRPDRIEVGGRGELVVRYTVTKGFHIYAPSHKGEMGMPLAATIDPAIGAVSGKPVEDPPPSEEKLFGETAKVLDGTGAVRFPITLAASLAPGTIELPVTVKHMACDATTCVPGEVEVRAEVTVTAKEAAGAGPLDSTAPDGRETTGLLWLVLSAFGAGLIAVLMPCTYPMIPITISYFTRRAEARKSSVFPLALAYGAGIVADFMIIGVLVGPLVLELASDWRMNLAIALLFGLFGLSLLGLFELRLPSSANALASRATGASSYFGVFLLGTTLVITSFACTGPFIGGVIFAGGARARGVLDIVVGMGAFGLAMALPFVCLALFPSAVKAMPRSGEWMHVVKVTFGFVLFVAGLEFFAKTDAARGWGLLSPALSAAIAGGIGIAASLYLLGVIRLKGESGEVGPVRLLIGVAVLVASLYSLAGIAEGRGAGGGGKAVSWTMVEDDFEGGLAKAASAGKRALINWTGVTCPNCKKMERSVFIIPEVIRGLEKYVEVRLHIDKDTDSSRSLRDLKAKRTGDYTLPLYEVVDPKDGRAIDAFRGADFGGKRFAEFLAKNSGGS
jgi:thiol:disulfide interchange protein